MKKMVNELQENNNAWPFIEPVSGVADYYEVIKEPMGFFIIIIDLRTLEEHVEADKYTTTDQFYKDVDLIYTNCRTYNADGSAYVKWYSFFIKCKSIGKVVQGTLQNLEN